MMEATGYANDLKKVTQYATCPIKEVTWESVDKTIRSRLSISILTKTNRHLSLEELIILLFIYNAARFKSGEYPNNPGTCLSEAERLGLRSSLEKQLGESVGQLVFDYRSENLESHALTSAIEMKKVQKLFLNRGFDRQSGIKKSAVKLHAILLTNTSHSERLLGPSMLRMLFAASEMIEKSSGRLDSNGAKSEHGFRVMYAMSKALSQTFLNLKMKFFL